MKRNAYRKHFLQCVVAPGILNVAINWYTDGVMVSNISHSGVQTQIRRDALRRETARIDGRGNVTRTEYDALGRVAATIDALTNATTYAYDAMNRVAAITNALGDATIYEYDYRGNKTYEGGATYPVRYTYDVYGNKTTMTTYRHEPEGGGRGATALPETDGTTVGRGDLSAPPGDTTTWLYDEASGVMTNKVYADGKGPCYTYTADGKLASRTWARGIVTTYSYDGWGNLVETTYSDDTPTVTVDYDALGRQVEAHDAAGVTTIAYDAYGNIIEQYGNRADEFAFRFSTKYYDHETGLVGYQRRFYRSDIGRWLNRDPIEEEGGINLYAFCFENPIAFCDADGAVVITGYILDPRVPHWWDHFGSDTAPLGQETWFDLNYSGWLNYARSYYKRDISRRIDCIFELLDFSSRRFPIKPTRRGGDFTTSGTVIRGNETIFGDEGQSAWSADKVLGRFAIDIVTPVRVSYECIGNCHREYHWETEIYVEDILGTQPGDKIYPLLKNIAKSRTVKRAIWKISGEGVCKCK